MIHPVPTLDHVVINVRDRMDAAAETWSRLGFTLTARGFHTLGSMNHLAVFGTDYLELLGVPAASNLRPELLAAPEGLNGLVFGSEDAVATWLAVEGTGVPVYPPEEFSRIVVLSTGGEHAAFRTVRLMPGVVDAGRLYSCQHLNRNLVWRDEWRHHANGTTGIVRAIIAANDPSTLAGVFGRMFGAGALRSIEGGCALTVGLSRFDIVTPEALHAEFGDAVPNARGRDSFMAALVFRTRSLDAAWAAMEQGNIDGACRDNDRIVVPARDASGTTLAFCL